MHLTHRQQREEVSVTVEWQKMGPLQHTAPLKPQMFLTGQTRGLPHLESHLDETRQPMGQRNRDKESESPGERHRS